MSVIGLYCFFHLAHSEPTLFASLALVYIGVFGSWPTGTGFGTEPFPTQLRVFGNSFSNAARYLGQSASFLLAGALMAGDGKLPRAVLVLSAGPVLAALLVAAFFPETAGRELEHITPDIPPTPRHANKQGPRFKPSRFGACHASAPPATPGSPPPGLPRQQLGFTRTFCERWAQPQAAVASVKDDLPGEQAPESCEGGGPDPKRRAHRLEPGVL